MKRFNPENLRLLRAAVQNVVTRVIWRLGFVHSWFTCSLLLIPWLSLRI